MIPLRCACGEKLQARDEHAGQSVRCPTCGAAVPAPSGNEAVRSAPPPHRFPVGCLVAVLGALAGAIGLSAFAVCRVQEGMDRTRTIGYLKQLVFAMRAYHDVHKHLPTQAIYSKDGKPLLSWRVAILPHINQDALYQQFKLDEPWDSPHNIRLLERMPLIYVPVRGDASPGHTHYQVFTGPNTAFNGPLPLRIPEDIPDGTSNTIFIVEADEPVPWTKPADLRLEPGGPLPPLGGLWGGEFYVGMGAGSVRQVNRETVSDRTLRLAIDPRDGQPLPDDF
jgi:hypothetical protein